MHKNIVVVVLFCLSLSAQQVQVNKENRTIAVTATESVSVDPDVAHITIGYQCYGITQNEAYAMNVRTSSDILKALQKAGIDKDQIETGTIKVDRVEVNPKWTDAQKRDRQFEAAQQWNIVVSAKVAAKVVDLAMRSGANDVEEISWDVTDHAMLQARAGGAALAKAHTIADQMAKGLGAKLGSLVYASNQAPATAYGYGGGGGRRAEMVEVEAGNPREAIPELSLFPEKVKQDATVYAVFAIE